GNHNQSNLNLVNYIGDICRRDIVLDQYSKISIYPKRKTFHEMPLFLVYLPMDYLGNQKSGRKRVCIGGDVTREVICRLATTSDSLTASKGWALKKILLGSILKIPFSTIGNIVEELV